MLVADTCDWCNSFATDGHGMYHDKGSTDLVCFCQRREVCGTFHVLQLAARCQERMQQILKKMLK